MFSKIKIMFHKFCIIILMFLALKCINLCNRFMVQVRACLKCPIMETSTLSTYIVNKI